MPSLAAAIRRPLPILAGLLMLAACAGQTTRPSAPALSIAQIDRGTMILLPDSLLFDAGGERIDQASAAPSLDYLCALLREKTDRPLAIEAHTDNRADEAARQAISQRHADALRQTLIACGLPERRLETIGYADARPLAPNDTELGRQLNRRIELVVLGENVEQLTRGEPVSAFVPAFDLLRRQLDQDAAD